MLKSFRGGFTLAEVLITLGIIGVVAAMTMPTLLNSTNGAQYRTAYKKALSVLSQAVVLNVALDDYDLSQTSAGVEADETNIYNLFMNRMNVVKTSAGGGDGEGWVASNDSAVKFGSKATTGNYTLFFNDGITFNFNSNDSGCTAGSGNGTVPEKICYGYIDVNGAKNPNKLVTCDGEDPADYDKVVDDCTVTNPTDMYPVKFYDQSILPNSSAAEAVLYGGK